MAEAAQSISFRRAKSSKFYSYFRKKYSQTKYSNVEACTDHCSLDIPQQLGNIDTQVNLNCDLIEHKLVEDDNCTDTKIADTLANFERCPQFH